MDHNSNYQYKNIKQLGQGTFGNVFLCLTNCYGSEKLVCIKEINIQNNNPKSEEMKLIRNEIYIISQLKHPRIIQYIDYFFNHNNVNIVMEYAQGGTLRDVLKRSNQHLTENYIRRTFCDILMGLEYLHIRGVVHRDLKPENVLIDHLSRPKISDFGISFVHTDMISETLFALGTPLYAPPEVINGKVCDYIGDIWSLGCILYEMCTYRNPFNNIKTMKELNQILTNSKYSHISCNTFEYRSSIQKICEEMLTFNANKRATISSLIINPWIACTYYKLYFDYNN